MHGYLVKSTSQVKLQPFHLWDTDGCLHLGNRQPTTMPVEETQATEIPETPPGIGKASLYTTFDIKYAIWLANKSKELKMRGTSQVHLDPYGPVPPLEVNVSSISFTTFKHIVYKHLASNEPAGFYVGEPNPRIDINIWTDDLDFADKCPSTPARPQVAAAQVQTPPNSCLVECNDGVVFPDRSHNNTDSNDERAASWVAWQWAHG
ncbi:hypothetical protein PCASD_16818 [Puccinia coronata f. sp. avenae]|uniref:Uncharacterized protein n=1 Tax=Puccinia coronata f. sp. avenae TaxID=200324 RepID=A0A2N5T066_9BASI|nr:hypothetical protein PCASD_16818 [Puccinia coronata f. sp. avenae]